MKKVRKISREYYLRQIVACWLVTCMLFAIPAQVALASDPPATPGTLPSGVIDRTGIEAPIYDFTPGAERMDMTQTASEAIVNWDNFDIGSTATVEFHQQLATDAVLNRVWDENVTGIYGSLLANGRVFIINPAGIVFGGSATINVSQLVASSLDILDADFLDGLPYQFTGGATAGDVMNRATNITAERLYLIGKRVGNRGTLVADDYVIMAAGDTVTISENSPVSVVVTMPEQTPGAYDYIVDNGGGDMDCGNGDIDADHVILAAGDIWSAAIEGVETLRAEAKGNAVFAGPITAYDDGGSDAVADITIITGGDFTVDDQIMAEADAPTGFNSSANVTIESTDGNVIIKDLVKAEADAEEGAGNATATVDIIADGYVDIHYGADKGEDVQADVWVVDSGDGTATVNITAGDYVDINGYIKAEAEGDNSGNMSATVDILSNVESEEEGVWIYDGAEVLANAEAENGSGNATANVFLEATGGLVDISDRVKAEAVGNGVDNAYATVTIDAAHNVSVLGDGEVMAEASDGVDNEANVNITGKNVTIETEGCINPAVVKAWAHDGVNNNTAGVTITATGIEVEDVVTEGDVIVEAAGTIDQALVEAKAEDGTNNTATVNITANDNVEVVSDGWNSFATIKAEAVDGIENLAEITIEATTGDVQLTHEGGGFLDFDRALIEAIAENSDLELPDDEDALTLEGLVNTATVTLNATEGDVLVTSSGNSAIKALAQNDIEINYDEFDLENSFTVEGLENNASVNLTGANVEITGVSGDATVEAIAKNEIDVEISHYEGDVALDLTVSDLENNATVTLNATDGDVLVQGGETVDEGEPGEPDLKTTLGDALVAAEAYNVVDIEQDTGGWWKNPDTDKWEKREDFAATLNLTTNDLTNDALVDIDATDNIKVIADGSKRRSESETIVRAEAYNELVGSGCEVKDVTVNLKAGLTLTDDNLVSLSNNADVQMTAANNNVEVTALRGGFASVKADAYNIVEGVEGVIDAACCHGGDIVVFVEADNIANDALVDIDAGDDVLVTAECDDGDSEVEVLAYAWNDIPGEPMNDAANITNNAQINIDATNVDVKSTNGGEASVIANAYDGTDNTAGVKINALGNVEVMHNDDAEAVIKAVATSPWGNNNTATIDIDAYANLLIDNGYVGAWAEGGVAKATVTVDTANVHVNNEGEIGADADSYFDDEGGALANVGITTTGIDGVVVENSSSIFSDALAMMDSGNATATTTVTASNVTVDGDSSISADAQALFGSGDATATTNITTTSSEIIVDNDSSIYSYAQAIDSGDATADTDILAGSVNILSSEVRAEAKNYTSLYVNSDMLDKADVDDDVADVINLTVEDKVAKATVDITATDGSVQVISAGVEAKAKNEVGIIIDGQDFDDDLTVNLTVEDLAADADVTILANEDVDIKAQGCDVEVEAKAKNEFAVNGSGGDLPIDIGLNLTVNTLEENTVAANANVDITATNGEVEIDGGSNAEVKAKAKNELNDYTNDIEVNETVDNVASNATVNITADGDATVDDGEVGAQAGTEGSEGDATATVTVEAANVYVEDDSEIYAEAYANDLGDAASTVSVTTTSSEIIVEDDSEIWSYAYTNDSGNATAKTTIEADDVTVDNDSEISAKAEAHDDSGDATATVDITTTGSEVTVEDDSEIYSYAYTDASGDATAKTTVIADDVTVDNESEIRAQAEAHNSGDATADVDIDAESVNILSSEVLAKAKKSTTLTVDYEMLDPDNVDDDVADEIALTVSGAATATVDITATDGDVQIKSDSRAKVMADAKNKVEINIDGDNFKDDITVNLTAEDLTADADVKITANEDVEMEAYCDDAIVKAEAESKFEVMASEGEEPEDPQVTLNLTVNPLEENTLAANANVDITATNGEVEIDGGSEARVEAIAITKLLDDEIDEDIDVTETADNVASNATVDIIAADDVTLDDGTVKAKAEAKGGEGDATAGVRVDAANLTVTDSEIKADAEAKDDAGDATANVDINMTGSDVLVEDESEIKADAKTKHGSGDAAATVTVDAANVTVVDDSEICAEAEAKYGSGDATATTDIALTGSDVLVEEDSSIYAEAYTGHGSGDAMATVMIDAANVTVSDDSEIEADAYAEYCSGDATALVDIDADGNVLVEDESWILAWAQTYYYGSGDATATVDILAGGNVTVSGSEVEDSEVTQSKGDSSKIMAHALTEQPKCEESEGSATADVDILAGGNVTASRDGKIVAVAVAKDGDGGKAAALQEPDPDPEPVITLLPRDATATVDIDAGGDVTVEKGSEVVAVAKIENVGTSDLATSLDNGDEEIVVIVPGNATALVDILAGGDVTVSMGSAVSAEAGIYNYAEYPMPYIPVGSLDNGEEGPPPLGDATATVDILAGGDVTIEKMDSEEDGVGAYAWIDNFVTFYHGPPIPEYPILPDLGDATANTYIDAGGDVTVSKGGSVYAAAELNNSGGANNSAVGSVENGNGNGGLELPGLGDATAGVEITTPGSLTVDKGGEVYAEASIEYDVGEFQPPSIGGLINGEVDEDSGDATASVIVDAFGGVTVGERSEIAADAWINSYTFGDVSDLGLIPESAPTGDASASVDILTCGDVIVDGLVGAYANINTQLIKGGEIDSSPNGSKHVYSGDTSADVLIRAYGDVIVNSEEEEEELDGDFAQSQGPSFGGQIEAVARNGEENSAAITILAVGDVIVNNGYQSGNPNPLLDSQEEIRAAASGGHINDAFIGIATRGGGLNPDSSPGDVIVSGQIGARTFDIDDGGSNTSNVEISAARDVIVNGGYAQYGSVRGTEGRERDAVQLEGEEGGQIMAGAQSGEQCGPGTYTNTANVNIFAGRDVTVEGAEVEFVGPVLEGGDFVDSYYDGGQIIALTRWNDYGTNTSSIGISAQRDVAIHDATITGQPFDIDFPDTEPFDVDLAGGELIAGAHGNYSTNDADIAICAMDNVVVDGDIEATAGTGYNGVVHDAHISIAAGNLITGTGSVIADADNQAAVFDAGITVYTTDMGNLQFTGEAYSTTDHGDTKIDPEVVVVTSVTCATCDSDWIDWLWCDDCEAGPSGFAPAAALIQLPLDVPLLLQGCPVEIEAAANELGITPGAMQLTIGNALALNPTLQACNACATLIDAASILRDEDGSRMAAMTQMFNDMAPSSLPYSPEMQALIVTAFAGAAEGSQYATVREYTDAFVRYFSVLDTDLASPVGDSLAFVMDKYGAGVLGSGNNNIAAFLAASLESGKTYGN